ncbi:MAG: hypothetical protein MK237_09345, partial [Gemmatimonadetes bacterium]|nr:hypothetical protein [Gemmatimonadota bacterium]
KKAMVKLAKRTFLAVLLLLALSFAGLQRLNHLSARPVELSEFSWFNKVEIYTAYVLMNALGAPLYPEIAKEASLMLLPSSEGQEMTFESDFFLESRFIQNALDNYSEPVRLAWPPNSYGLGNAETRIALALNTGTLHVEDGKAKVSVPCTWPKQSLVNVGLPGLLDIRVQEGLFWVLEQEGWIYPYTAVWEADLPVN